MVEKHSPARFSSDRLMPASKNSPFRAPLLGVLLLSVNDQGIVTVIGFTSPQARSPLAAVVGLGAGAVQFSSNLTVACPPPPPGLFSAGQVGCHPPEVVVGAPPPL